MNVGIQGIWWVIWPSTTMVITPPDTQVSIELLFSAGRFASITVGEPVTHGAGVFGRQGPGVSTPSAADVAAAVAGFRIDMQVPNGMMLTIGTWSLMLAAGWLSVLTILTGSTTSVLGAAPIAHLSVAPLQT